MKEIRNDRPRVRRTRIPKKPCNFADKDELLFFLFFPGCSCSSSSFPPGSSSDWLLIFFAVSSFSSTSLCTCQFLFGVFPSSSVVARACFYTLSVYLSEMVLKEQQQLFRRRHILPGVVPTARLHQAPVVPSIASISRCIVAVFPNIAPISWPLSAGSIRGDRSFVGSLLHPENPSANPERIYGYLESRV